jgi:hypothetical protein
VPRVIHGAAGSFFRLWPQLVVAIRSIDAVGQPLSIWRQPAARLLRERFELPEVRVRGRRQLRLRPWRSDNGRDEEAGEGEGEALSEHAEPFSM